MRKSRHIELLAAELERESKRARGERGPDYVIPVGAHIHAAIEIECDACHARIQARSKRLVKLRGRRISICRPCYKKGPTAVETMLNQVYTEAIKT